jgi:DNA (cytosine-5)-methyltransferase 1
LLEVLAPLAVPGVPRCPRGPHHGRRWTGEAVSDQLVLSLFPGIGLLDHAFELEGFCVVRGPDVLWGGDVRTFHPPTGVFDGVIGGPPCQAFSQFRYINPLAGQKHGNLIPEFERCVAEAQPRWFVMENVSAAPAPTVNGYGVDSQVLDNRWLGEAQQRRRRISFGVPGPSRRLSFEIALFEASEYAQSVNGSSRAVNVKLGGSGKVKRTYTADGKRHLPGQGPRTSVGDMLELQGAARDLLDESPFTESAKRQMIGNGVPVPMGRAIARAVRRALGLSLVSQEAAHA